MYWAPSNEYQETEMENLGYTMEYKPIGADGWNKIKSATIEGSDVKI